MAKTRNSALMLWVIACLLTSTAWSQCGKERWSVKTGTDSGAGQIDLTNPQAANISDLVNLPAPNPLPTDTRFDPTENTVFVVTATLTDYKIESDSDYHLVLLDDQGDTMIAEIPSPSCVDPSSPFVSQITNARAEFDAQLTATSSFQTANISVQVTGVGFFDFFHRQHGVAPNVIELHPILDIQFNPAPAPTAFMVSAAATAMHLHPNQPSSLAVTAASMNGGAAPDVKLSVSGLPPGVSSQISPGPNGKENVTFLATSSAPSGTFPVTITGSAKGHSRSQTISLNLSSAPESEETSRWEYKMITAPSEQEITTQANKLGSEDWEMVSVVRLSANPAWRAFFKRLVKD
jgi:hypothetical protein